MILLGLLFKETTAVLCISFFFLDIPMKERLRYFVVTAALFVAAKVSVDLAVGNRIPFFSMTTSPPTGGSPRIVENLRILASARLAHPVLINAGTLVALAVLPGRSRTLTMARWVAIAFTVNTFFFAMIDEYRIWFELAPLAVYALACRFEAGGPEAAEADGEAAGRRTDVRPSRSPGRAGPASPERPAPSRPRRRAPRSRGRC